MKLPIIFFGSTENRNLPARSMASSSQLSPLYFPLSFASIPSKESSSDIMKSCVKRYSRLSKRWKAHEQKGLRNLSPKSDDARVWPRGFSTIRRKSEVQTRGGPLSGLAISQ